MALSRGIVAVLQIIFVLQANADECEEIGICDHLDNNYPTALAKDLIKELKSINTVFNSDEFEIDLGFRFNVYRHPNRIFSIGSGRENRFSYPRFYHNFYYRGPEQATTKRQEFCEITKKQIIPMKAKDAGGMMRYIVNDKDNPVQKFNTAICKNRESKCTDLLGFISQYTGVCIQNFVLREMIYVNDKNQSETGYFQVPTCCSCKLLRIN